MGTFLLAVVTLVHPFHVSVTDIKFKSEQRAIQISMRVFLDDLELGLQAYTGDEKLDILDETKWDFIKESLKPYVLENFYLADEKGRVFDLQYVGAEIEEDVMWCYLEVEKVKKLTSVTLRNTILHEVWNDQENLVHFRAYDQVKSERLYKGESTKIFNWE